MLFHAVTSSCFVLTAMRKRTMTILIRRGRARYKVQIDSLSLLMLCSGFVRAVVRACGPLLCIGVIRWWGGGGEVTVMSHHGASDLGELYALPRVLRADIFQNAAAQHLGPQ